MVGIIIIAIFIIVGTITGLNVLIPYSYSQYIAVAILACLDSVCGAFVANIENKFKMSTFLSGFFCNAIIAMLLVFIGNKLNVDLYLGAVIVFTGRLLNNFSAIRRHYIEKWDEKKKENNINKIKINNKTAIK
ncbi:MAG: small basic family protein [Clostridia bacterium]